MAQPETTTMPSDLVPDDGPDRWSRDAFLSTSTALAVVDVRGVLVSANPAFAKLIGRNSAEFIGRPLRELWSIDISDPDHPLLKGLDTDGAVTIEVEPAPGDHSAPHSHLRFVWLPRDQSGSRRIGFQVLDADTVQRKRKLSVGIEGMQLSFDQLAVGVYITGLDGVVSFVNAAMCRILGRTRDELAELDIVSMIHPDDRAGDMEYGLRVVAGEIEGWTREKRMIKSDGSLVWLQETVSLVRGNDGEPFHFLSQFVDITDRVDARQTSERLSELLEEVEDVVVITDPRGSIIHLNRAGRAFLPTEGHGGDVGLLFELFTDLSREHIRLRAVPSAIEEGFWTGELEMHEPGHAPRVVSLSIVAHRDVDDRLEYLSAITRDISRLKEAEERLRQQATHDVLTGLPNRTILFDRLNNAIARSKRSGAGVAVLFIDLDHFKPVNDQWGHEAGDDVLVQVGGRLSVALREHDTVARMGGDEFVIVAEPIESVNDALVIANRIVTSIGEPFVMPFGTVSIGASVGVALNKWNMSARDLVHAADLAVYKAKAQGRSCVAMAEKSDVA